MRLLTLGVLLVTASSALAGPTTYDGKYDLSTINLTVVYFVPKDRTPLPDWKDRVEYYPRRVSAFHHRELDGLSKIKADLYPKPLVSEQSAADFRRGNQDATFFKTMEEVRTLLKWKNDRANGFPVLLVLSDINWRELDDFRRVRTVDGKEVHEGNIGRNGRHFPGAESGGARAIYIPDPGYGMGLVSGDGWRVPYAGGSDCVVYHEGLGHSVGLPHPDPTDNTVMGIAQYQFWINEAKLNAGQKQKLGWKPPEKEQDRSGDLFTHFTALQKPIAPKVGQTVTLSLKWPKGARVKELKVRLQTDLFGKWETIPTNVTEPAPTSVPLKSFDHPTPVSYRVDVTLEDGQTAEIWGYFQVK
ncbi:hypothetical protein [Fimbriiglobus ruber]|uniref:Secreted protein n=1 Tax=Fimbriiglobus ruber TaxID=1908690 RepID=A0A225DAC8_9BACT|nr:hypothetical protein [Fimbriiglobus ruber]OWK38511.1 hypothetical protein FRUB_07631 [Fimbriiglobus ruber]